PRRRKRLRVGWHICCRSACPALLASNGKLHRLREQNMRLRSRGTGVLADAGSGTLAHPGDAGIRSNSSSSTTSRKRCHAWGGTVESSYEGIRLLVNKGRLWTL